MLLYQLSKPLSCVIHTRNRVEREDRDDTGLADGKFRCQYRCRPSFKAANSAAGRLAKSISKRLIEQHILDIR